MRHYLTLFLENFCVNKPHIVWFMPLEAIVPITLTHRIEHKWVNDWLAHCLYAVCVTAGYLMSYFNRPFFPEWCGDAILDDHVTYDTVVRIAGSFSGIAHAFKAVADMYSWTHIVLLSDDNTKSLCWYGATPFDEVFSQEDNYTFTWLRLGSNPTDKQLDDILQQVRARTRGLIRYCV